MKMLKSVYGLKPGMRIKRIELPSGDDPICVDKIYTILSTKDKLYVRVKEVIGEYRIDYFELAEVKSHLPEYL